MTTRPLGKVPSGCRARLLAHYGPSVEDWLEAAPCLLAEAAGRWKLTLKGYHDAGHASAVAVANTDNGVALILKAWVEPARYLHETAALRVWAGGPAPSLVAVADDLSVAALELVGGRPGGALRPSEETHMVATVIQQIHSLGQGSSSPKIPRLADFLRGTVMPRIRQRMQALDLGAQEVLVQEAFQELETLREEPGRTTVLHADLYPENVIFDGSGRPCLIDPHPLTGDAVFDWAFWTVYHGLEQGMTDRLAESSRTCHIPVSEIVPWCRALAVDGLLYYREIRDPAELRILDVLSSLMVSSRVSSR